jgi:hypothetical protein
MAASDPPTTKQQRELRRLAQKTGNSFTPPRTRREASREIRRLRARTASSSYERHADRTAVDEGLERRGDAAAVRKDEISGYGSSATWR